MTENGLLNELEEYIPSSSEKKQAVMMYAVVGLLLSMGKQEVSPFIHHHIKQSLGWLSFFVFVFFIDVFLIIFGIILRVVGFFFFFLAAFNLLLMLSIGIMCIIQAGKGKYVREAEYQNKFFGMFSGFGTWILNLFDKDHYQIIDEDRYRKPNQFDIKKEEKIENVVANNIENGSTSSTTQDIPPIGTEGGIQSIQGDMLVQNTDNGLNGGNSLDNNQEISINTQNVGIDLSVHEINKPGNQI